jgi:outer membrane receptor protein involved in Fe transport
MKPLPILVASLTVSAVAPAGASTADAGGSYALETITVVATGVSNASAASVGDVSQEQLSSQPLLRPGAILENVPGLIVTQHSGEGKANQYFLRAFNLDHGTDLASEVDDMPVNMPSHAHGQGYSDLNFLIPELIADLHYKKGPYYADEGDFATAGAVRMDLLSETPPRVFAGYGEDGYRRGLLLGSMDLGPGTLLAAGEIYHNDGPFDVPDDYHRSNGVLRYRSGTEQSFWTLTAMAYNGTWNATDQVPERAIEEGLIDRFGSLNPTDGGESSRASLSFNGIRRTDDGQLQASAYVIRYKLDLWSTFTYYLKDPVYGDQMLQHDDRVVYGFKASQSWFGSFGSAAMTNVIGLQARLDDIRDVSIHPTYQRQVIGTTQDAGVTESNAAVYAENTIQWSPWLRSTLGLRADAFDFDVRDKMVNADGSCNIDSDPLGCNTGNRRAALLSPKLGIVLGPWARTSFFIDAAAGYHSNDARGITRSGQNPQDPPVTPLTRAKSAEMGLSSTLIPNWQTSLDVFLLKLQSELVFSGDAGVTSPSGATTRTGVEWGNTYHVNHWISADLNAAFTRGRFDHDVPPDDLGCSEAALSHPCAQPIAITGRYIPNSPTDVIDAGITAHSAGGVFAAARARHFGASPLVEDDSARSPAYTTIDLEVGYGGSDHWRAALDLFNVCNVKWNDIEYYYVSRLQNEASPHADYVIHPGIPRTLRAWFEYRL